jgi:LysR family transcriptional regulator, hydrogen peroxide-inducible genes activator
MSAPHPFTLRQLQYAVAVAESLSFRKAAERCHVSQPSLSAQLAQLEDALGVRLFERDRRRVLPTRAGEELLARARLLLVEADDLVAASKSAGDPLAGTLRVGVIPTISPYLLPVVAPALRSAFPRLRVTWIEDKTRVLVERLDAGTLDAALLALEAEIGEFEHEVIARDAFVLATPLGHPLGASSSPARPSELRGTSVLLLDEGHCFREQALSFCSRAHARELEFRATSLATLVQMVAGGAGVTLLPTVALPTEGRRGDLRLRSFVAPAPHRTIALIWRKRSPLGPPLRQVAVAMRSAYPAPPPIRSAQPARSATTRTRSRRRA